MKKGTKKNGNMSQIIRDYAEKNPGVGPTQIAKDLVAQGHKAYPALVSQALRGSASAKKRKPSKRGRKPGSKAAAAKPAVAELNVQSIKATSDFIKLHGSADEAVAAIRTYQKISALFQ
ncbi:MAG: hypothetical protein ACK52S_06920 [Pirellula sp.]